MAKYKRTTGADKNFKYTGRVVRYDGIYIAFVKDNADAQRMGRLKVWIPEFGSQPDDEGGWVTVSYVSPFAGATNPNLIGNNTQAAGQSQTSYGWWAVPPDLENQVVVMFINGDPSRGVWLGCLFQQFMNHMVPGAAAGDNFRHGQDVPVAEYNKKTPENVRNDIRRPELTTHREAISSQGLINDNIRGITNTSARREVPSQVYGLITPGPVDPNSDNGEDNPQGQRRLGGHQFYFDDGQNREHFRIRSRNGAQLLIDDTNGLVYAINRNGTSWIQMDAEGNFDIFAAQSVSIRSQRDINFRADRDLILEAGRNIKVKAVNSFLGSSDGSVGDEDEGTDGGTIRIEALNDMQTIVKNNHSIQITEGDMTVLVSEGNHAVTIGGDNQMDIAGDTIIQTNGSMDLNVTNTLTISASEIGIGTNNFNLETSGSLQASGNIIASGNIFGTDVFSNNARLSDLTGHKHVITSGSSAGNTAPFTSSGSSSSASGPSAAEATPVEAFDPLTPIEKTNVLATFSDDDFERDTETVLTVVGRFLTFEPCPEHINKGQS